jgi:putative NADH-flavin reductase
LVVSEGLARGHEITGFVRNAQRAGLGEGVKLVQGDVLDAESVRSAVAGQDAVIIALGSKNLFDSTVRSGGTSRIIESMVAEGVGRLVAVSAMGIGDSWNSLSWFNRLFFATLLRASRIDHEAQEAAIKASTLDWTILRPSALTDDPPGGDYELGETIRGETVKISRGDVARALLDALESDTMVGRAVTITQ